MKEKLKKVLKEQGVSQYELAELLNLTYQTVSIKMNGHKDFTQSEIRGLKLILGLTPEQIDDIFFSSTIEN